MFNSRLVLSLALLTTSACTTQMETRPDVLRSPALVGAAYHLPELRYDLSFTDTITSCPKIILVGSSPVMVGGVSVSRKSSATASYVAGERIAVDLDALTSLMKTAKYGFQTYDSGIVKGINAGAEDQTGPLLKSVVSVALSAYGLLNPVSAPGLGPSGTFYVNAYGETPSDPVAGALDQLAAMAEPASIATCKPAVAEAFETSSSGGSTLDGDAAALETINAEVDALKLAAVSRAANHDDLVKLVDAMKRQAVAKSALAELKAQVEKVKGKLTVSDERHWTPGPAGWSLHAKLEKLMSKLEASSIVPVLSDRQIARWWNGLPLRTQIAVARRESELVTALGVKPGLDKGCGKCDPAPTFEELRDHGGSLVWLKPSGDLQPASWQTAAALQEKRSGRIQGLVVREPLPMRLLICKSAANATCDTTNAESVSAEQLVPQAGPYRLLPFRNGPFEAATISASFRENGRMETFAYERTKAPASGVSAIGEALVQVEAFKEKREKAAIDKRSGARAEELAGIDHQISLLTKEKQLLALQTPPEIDVQKAQAEEEAARLNAEIALLNARRSKLEAEALLLAAAGTQ